VSADDARVVFASSLQRFSLGNIRATAISCPHVLPGILASDALKSGNSTAMRRHE
jgi:hypothetical protein